MRAVSDPDNVCAEFAIIIASALKGQDLGRVLLGKMVCHVSSVAAAVPAPISTAHIHMRARARRLILRKQGEALPAETSFTEMGCHQ